MEHIQNYDSFLTSVLDNRIRFSLKQTRKVLIWKTFDKDTEFQLLKPSSKSQAGID